MSYFLYASYKLLFIAQVTKDFLHTSYALLVISQFTSYSLVYELRL